MPGDAQGRVTAGWQVYLDNFATMSVHKRSELERQAGLLHEWHKAARDAWKFWKIPSAEDKSLAFSTIATELGCEFRGERGTIGTTRQRRLEAIGLALFVVSQPSPHLTWLAMVAGRWSFCFQFRRAVSSVFAQTWSFIANWKSCRFLPPPVAQELLHAAMLAPLMRTNLRCRPDMLVTASDASESGGGACAAAGLTNFGVQTALTLSQPVSPSPARGVVLVSLFGGIEAGMRAFNLLGVRVMLHISAEIDPQASRVARDLYPDMIHVRDVHELQPPLLAKMMGGIDPLLVIIISGSPCQGLSGLNAQRKELDDPCSQIFFEAVRVT